MDWSKNSTTNSFVITFNGVNLPCSADMDCPGRAFCATQNKTFPGLRTYVQWTEIDQCACSTVLMWTGALCDEHSSFSQTVFALHTLVCCLASCGLLVLCYDMQAAYLLMRKGILRFDAHLATAISAWLALIAVIWMNAGLAQTFAGDTFRLDYPVPGKKGVLRSTDSRVAVALTFFFGTISGLNVSAVWFDVAAASRKLRTSTKHKVLVYKRVLAVYELVYLTVVVVGLVFGNYSIIVGTSIPALLVIAITYPIGYSNLNRVIREVTGGGGEMGLKAYEVRRSSAASNKESENTTANSPNQGYAQALAIIRSTTMSMALVAMLTICLFVIFVAQGGFEADGTPDRGPLAIFLNGLIWIAVTTLMLIVVRYTHLVFEGKRKRLDSSAKSAAEPQSVFKGPASSSAAGRNRVKNIPSSSKQEQEQHGGEQERSASTGGDGNVLVPRIDAN